jgi:hypothetical protein
VPEGKENIELTGGGEIGGRDVVDASPSMIDAGVDYAIDQGIEGIGDLHTFVGCLFTTMVLASRGQINHRLSSMGCERGTGRGSSRGSKRGTRSENGPRLGSSR